MPAIRVQLRYGPPKIINHYHHKITHNIDLLRKGGGTIEGFCVGFICNAGAAHYKTAVIAKALAMDITNEDGALDSNWRTVPEGEYVWCIAKKPDPWHPEVLIIVDDFGWPILTGKHRYEFIPPHGELETGMAMPPGYMDPHPESA